MTIEQFQKVFELSEGVDSFDYKIKALSIITGRSIDDIESLSIEDFKKLSKEIDIPNTDNLSDKLIFETKVSGIKFEAVINVKSITAAEFLEVSAFTKDEKTIIKNLHKLLAIFYKPKSKWFGLKKVTMKRSEVADLFLKNMDIQMAYPLSVFFLESWKSFTIVIRESLDKKMRQAIAMTKAMTTKHRKN